MAEEPLIGCSSAFGISTESVDKSVEKQVSGRSELDFDDLVHLDFIYLESWSLALDLTILLKTLPAVLLRRGAY